MAGEQLQLGVLGPLTVTAGGRAVRIAGPRPRGLLAMLASRCGEPVSADELLEGVWTRPAGVDARSALQVSMSRLRKQLGADVIVTAPSGYLLDVAQTAVDAARFAAAATTWADPGRSPGEAADRLEEALHEWRGPAYAEFAGADWAAREADRLGELRALAEESLAARRLRLGHVERALPDLMRLAATYPLRERTCGLLMLALYRTGRQADALLTYASLRNRLVEELGSEPSEPVRHLRQAIICQDPELLRNDRPLLDGRQGLRIGPRPRPRQNAGRFVGREAEQAELTRRWSDMHLGQGSLVIVSGPPGIGKTRLIEEAADGFGPGFLLSGRCFDSDWAPPFAPVGEALNQVPDGVAQGVLGGLGPAARQILGTVVPAWQSEEPTPLVSPADRRQLLLDSICRFLTRLADVEPVLLVLEDLQWADRGTAELLRLLARRVATVRLLVLGSCRPPEPAGSAPITEVIGSVSREERFLSIRLPGIGLPAITELAASMTSRSPSEEAIRSLERHSGGNPFYVIELLRCGDAGTSGTVPAPIHDLVVDRLARVQPSTQTLIETAAVCEHPFRLEAAADVAGLDGAALLTSIEAATAANFLVPDSSQPDCYVFAHDLTRTALLTAMTPARVLRLHRRWAETLARRPDSDPAEVAVHYQASADLGEAPQGAEFALAAARRAERAGAHEKAVQALDAALAMLADDDPRRLSTLASLARALAWALQPGRAAAVAMTVADLLATREGPEAAVGFAGAMATILSASGVDEPSVAVARHALAYPSDRTSPAWAQLRIIELDHRDVCNPDNQGIVVGGAERKQAARVIAAGLAGAPARYPYSDILAAAFDSRQEVLDYPTEYPGLLGFWAGEYTRASELLSLLAPRAEEQGEFAWAAISRNNLGRCQRAMGLFGRADDALARAKVLAERAGQPPSVMLNVLAAQDERCLCLDDGWDDLLASADDIDTTGSDNRWAMAAFTAALARINATLGDPDGALACLEAVIGALTRASGWAINYTRMACDAASVLWLLDRKDHHATITEAVREKVVGPDFRYPMFDGRLSLARLAALDGDRDEAGRWFGAAAAVLDQQQAWPLRAVVEYDVALMLLRGGRPSDRRQGLARAKEAETRFRALGMTGWEIRAAAVATELAGSPV